MSDPLVSSNTPISDHHDSEEDETLVMPIVEPLHGLALPEPNVESADGDTKSGSDSDSDSDDDDLFSHEMREIVISHGVSESGANHCNNVVITSRYTPWNFVPKNLFEQFSELANLYFLFIGLLQIVPEISTTQGLPTIYMPLAFIVFVSAIRAAVEDYHRHKADEQTSSTPYHVYSREGRSFQPKRSGDIAVGDIVMVKKDETVPADMIILSTSDARNGQAFVDKKSLNGETSLEIMLALRETYDVYNHPDAVSHLRCKVTTNAPDGVFDNFFGTLELYSTKEEIMHSSQFWSSQLHQRRNMVAGTDGLPPSEQSQTTTVTLNHKMLMLRETSLRSTEWAIGLVVYTGKDTKIRQNVLVSRLNRKWWQRADIKKTRVFLLVDRFLVWMLVTQIVLCVIAGVFAGIWRATHGDSWYLRFPDDALTTGFLSFFSFFIILSQMVPISLIVTAELVKMFLSFLIEEDHTMYSADKDERVKCNKSTIHEDLGQVDYVLSDKTGTLTKNKMEFRFALVMGVSDTLNARSSSIREDIVTFTPVNANPELADTTVDTSAMEGVLCFGKMETEMSKRAQAREAEFREEQQARREGRRVRPRPAHLWTELVASMHDSQLAHQHGFPHKQQLLNTLWGPRPSSPSYNSSQGPTAGVPSLGAQFGTGAGTGTGTGAGGDGDDAATVYSTNPPQLDPINVDSPWLHPEHSHARVVVGYERQRLLRYLLNCALNNTVTPYYDSDGALQYTTESADELALVQFARSMGVVLSDRDPDDSAVLTILLQKEGRGADETHYYRKLGTFHFTSERKRVTVVYERVLRRDAVIDGKVRAMYDSIGAGEVYVMCKGQDTVMTELLHNPNNDWSKVQRAMQHMCKAGLRTMLLAEARVSKAWWARVQADYEQLDQLCLDRTRADTHMLRAQLDAMKTNIERQSQLCLLGATGLEDELQELVPECISDMLRAGIKVWMLTGDKKETAKNIALACCLIDPDMLPDTDRLNHVTQRHLASTVTELVHQSRIIEVTGEWASLAQDPTVLQDLFRYFATARNSAGTGSYDLDTNTQQRVSYGDMVTLLAGLGVEEAANGPTRGNTGSAGGSAGGHPLSDSLRVVFDVYDNDGDGYIDYDQFCAFMRQVQVSPFDAVEMDVLRGLRTAQEMAEKGLAVSLLVTKEAFAVICPPPRIDNHIAKNAKKNRKNGNPCCDPSTPAHGAQPTPLSPPNSPSLGSMSPLSSPFPPGAVTSPHAAVFDPRVTLRRRHALRYRFFQLAAQCRSVVFAGAEPPMKERMVRELSERCQDTMQHPQAWCYPDDAYITTNNGISTDQLKQGTPPPPTTVRGAVTLAIGDGANDELMIKAAHVGVGISGVEGAAAVKAADYAIAQFSFLHTLLFVHGMWCYHRVSYLVHFVFYKAALVALTMFFFGFFSGFSGQQLFNEPIYQFFNIMFTAMPVLCLATFDRILDRDTLENNPEVYRSMRKESVFSSTSFLTWIARAFGHAAVVFFVGFLCLSVNNVSNEDGREHGLYLVAAAVYMSVVMLASVIIILDMHSITWLHVFSVLFSFASFFIVVICFSLFNDFNVTLYGVIIRMLSSPTVWVVVLVTTLFPLFIDIAGRHFAYLHGKTLVQILKEQQVIRAKRQELLSTLQAASPAVRFSRMQEFDQQHPPLPDLRLYKPFAHVTDKDKATSSTSATTSTVDETHDQAMQEHGDMSGVVGVLSPQSSQSEDDMEHRAQMQRAVVATLLRFRNLTGSYFESAQWQAGTENRSRDFTRK